MERLWLLRCQGETGGIAADVDERVEGNVRHPFVHLESCSELKIGKRKKQTEVRVGLAPLPS